MEPIETQEYICRCNRGIVVHRKKPQQVVVTTIDYKTGKGVSVTKPIDQVIPGMGDESVLNFSYQDNGLWIGEYAAGCRRWFGEMSGRKLSAGLRRLGFQSSDVSIIMKSGRGKVKMRT